MDAHNPPAPERRRGSPRRIAIVESDDLIRELLVRWLQEAGYSPVPVDPADLLPAAPFVLVIANVAEPRSAASLLRRLHAAFAAPILLISARFRRGLSHAPSFASEIGAAAVLPKPFRRAELLAVVKATALAHPPPRPKR